MSAVVESAERAHEITSLVPEEKLSGFNWVCLAYVWSQAVSDDIIERHPHRREFKRSLRLGRLIQEVASTKPTLSRSKSRHLKRSTAKLFQEIVDESEAVISSLREQGISEPWLDWNTSTPDEYLSHIAYASAISVRDLALACKGRQDTDTFDGFHDVAKMSCIVVAYSTHFTRDHEPAIRIVFLQAEKLADDKLGGKLGRPVPKPVVKLLSQQSKNIASRQVHRITPRERISSAVLMRVGLFGAGVVTGAALLSSPGNVIVPILMMLATGLLGSGFLMFLSRKKGQPFYLRSIYILCAVLFFIEAVYLSLQGIGVL